MPTRRFENIDPERRKKILDAAQKEFTKSGYEGASLNEIIQEAEISKGSLYYYFEDKTDLYLTVIKNVMEDIFTEIGGITAGEFSDDFWADLEKYFKQMIKMILENQDSARLFRGLYHLSKTAYKPDMVAEFYDAGKAVTAEIIKHGQEMGAVRRDIPLELLVNIVFSLGEALDLWLFEQWEKYEFVEIEKTAALYTDLFRRIAGAETVKGDGEA